MKDQVLSRALHVDDRLRAAALSDPLRRRVVLCLVGRERSLTDLSVITGLELKRLHYHVTVLLKLELLKVHDELPRAGRPIKRYVAVAEAFFVPDSLVDKTPGEALASELRNSLIEQRRISTVGSIYYVGADGGPRMRPVRRSDATELPWLDIWHILPLSRQRAKQLADELSACLQRFSANETAAGGEYLVNIALAPTQTVSNRIPLGRRPRAPGR